MDETRGGVGRTEVSVRLDCIFVPVLSHGHGPKSPCFQGVCKHLEFNVLVALFQRKHENAERTMLGVGFQRCRPVQMNLTPLGRNSGGEPAEHT